jgi:hypothetical protein
MKNLIFLFVICLFACSKSGQDVTPPPVKQEPDPVKPVPPPTSPIEYILAFEIENELPIAKYYIQVSKDKQSFTTMDSLSFNALNNGAYSDTLKINTGEWVRVITNHADSLVYSAMVGAE